MRRCGRCALVAGVIGLLLGPLLLLLAKGGVDAALRDEASAALAARGLPGVTASSDWAALSLTGPGSARDAALAAVRGIADRSGVDTVTYHANDAGTAGSGSGPSAAAGSGSGSPAPSTAAPSEPAPSSAVAALAVKAEVTGSADPRTITLSGTVATQEQHDALAAAATAAYGAGHVTDELTVAGTGPGDPGADGAVTRLASVLTAFGPAVTGGTADLAGSLLTVSATARDAATAATANAALGAADGAGLTVSGTVAPPAAPAGLTGAQVGAQLAQLLAVRGVTFDSGSAALTATGAATLDRVAAVLARAPGVEILVAGHTDDQGSAADNQALSAARAAGVKAYLVAHRIAAGRISTAAFGATRPVAGNDTPQGRLANRRIDLTVVGS